VATLCVDQPGSGEALRLQDLPVDPHSEHWASRALDWLQGRDEVDSKHMGMVGISLGGHFAPRAVAFEPRFAAGAVWGANHNWAEVQHKRLQKEGERPVPHYWSHVLWAFGAESMDDFLARAAAMHLNGVMERIRVPFLVTHGAKDRQISLDYARQSFEQLTQSPARELKIFTEREGGVEHVGADNMSYARDYIADWFAVTLGGRTG
jgi:dienelactone hydrolase